eukprot:gene7327-7539_t
MGIPGFNTWFSQKNKDAYIPLKNKSFSTEQRKSGSQQQKKKKRKQQVVSSTALTPGTPCMHDICVSVLYYVSCRLTNRRWQHLEFEVSGPTVPGEGEVKILGRLARPRSQESVSPADTHVIVGDDADLILMALVSMTPHLLILNTALSDNQLSLATPVLSVDHLHASWLAKRERLSAGREGSNQAGCFVVQVRCRTNLAVS